MMPEKKPVRQSPKAPRKNPEREVSAPENCCKGGVWLPDEERRTMGFYTGRKKSALFFC